MLKYAKITQSTALCVSILAFCGCDQSRPTSTSLQDSEVVYAQLCSSCHGKDMSGGLAASLLDTDWAHGAADADLTNNIRKGIDAVGMPSFEEALSDEEIENLVKLIRYTAESHQSEGARDSVSEAVKLTKEIDPTTDVTHLKSNILISDFMTGIGEPWGFAFLDDHTLIATEKEGNLVMLSKAEGRKKIQGTPVVRAEGQGGMLDVALDPDFGKNGWIYLSYAHSLAGNTDLSMTKVIRGRISNESWVDEEVIFQAEAKDYVEGGRHYGTRMAFDDANHLYFSVGDRGLKDDAQNLKVPNGKIHRVYRDGSIPQDNPFVGEAGAYDSIYSLGSRNAQGLVWHPDTGEIWETEHGPRGGDELNLIRSGVNYGWPEISYGINYDGSILTPDKAKPGMAQPISHWTPSIAVCGLDVYTGDLFPEWKGRLLVGSLANETVRLVDIAGNKYQSEAIIFEGAGRIRQVKTGPDGAIYIALPDRIVRLSPLEK